MGLAALAAPSDPPNNRAIIVSEMTHLLDEISSVISDPGADRAQVERTLTDGYAHALALEAERSRLRKRVDEVTQGLGRDRSGEKAQELSALAQRLDGNALDLSALRQVLAELKRRRATLS
jgi:hypothetical protein